MPGLLGRLVSKMLGRPAEAIPPGDTSAVAPMPRSPQLPEREWGDVLAELRRRCVEAGIAPVESLRYVPRGGLELSEWNGAPCFSLEAPDDVRDLREMGTVFLEKNSKGARLPLALEVVAHDGRGNIVVSDVGDAIDPAASDIIRVGPDAAAARPIYDWESLDAGAPVEAFRNS